MGTTILFSISRNIKLELMGDRHTKKIFLVVEKIVVLSYYANLQIQNKDKIKKTVCLKLNLEQAD